MEGIQELQNGSDIRGIAIATEEHQANITPEIAGKIAAGILYWLVNKKNLATKYSTKQVTIAIGHDSRLSAEGLKEGLIQTLLKSGVHVIDVGLATTPALFLTTQFDNYQCDAGIMITASHLPYYFNGIKIFTKDGGAEKEDIQFILQNCEKECSSPFEGTVSEEDLISQYAEDLTQKIREGINNNQALPLKDFHIIVDAGNGAGGFFASKVLEVLGAKTTGSQFLDPDGYFPNHIPNPDNKVAMESIQTAVLANQADLGVIFDTDVDRAAVVDQKGNVLNRNNLIAVLASIVLKERPNSAIVTNSPTSSHLKVFIEKLGGKQVRYLCGYRNVINKAIELNRQGISTELAIETSGHAAFKENYFLDDGAYVIAKILMLLPQLKAQGRKLSDLISELQQPLEAEEIRFKIEAKNVREYGQQIIDELEYFAKDQKEMEVDCENEEGIRVNVSDSLGSGWFLLRMSLHEPLLVLQVENDQEGKNKRVFQELAHFFVNYQEIDQSALKKKL